MRRSLVAVSIAALAFPLLAACGSSGGSTASTASETSAATDLPTTPAATSAACVQSGATVPKANTTVGETPAIEKPTGAPPCKLIVKDLVVGSGAPVTDITKTYSWDYEGVSWSNGQKFDSSFDRGQPAPFALNQVIPGWTTGLQGMKPGGRRILVIPPDQAYGAGGQGGIGPNETLVFVVDLVGPAAS